MLRDTVKSFNGMGLFRDLYSSFFGDKQIEQQNEANMWLAQYQNQVQEQMYNKYSSPAALMRQYREAGLNPNLVYGSASAGQHNVPSYQAPSVERFTSGKQKIDAALSGIMSALNIKQGIYQVDAARESAEQSAIKTLSDQVDLMKKRGDLRKENTIWGSPLYYGEYVRHRKDRYDNQSFVNPGTFAGDSAFMRYAKAYRTNQFNSLIRSQYQNAADFGLYYDNLGNPIMDQYFGIPYMRTRNADANLNYRLRKEIGNTGTYGKLLISLLGLL